MRLLIDTQIFLWLTVSPERVRAEIRAMLREPDVTLFFSAASAWEIAIKYAKGNLPLPVTPEIFLPTRMQQYDMTPLSVEHRHAVAVAGLPRIHGDPFDRLLVAQAIVEGVPIVTADQNLSNYPVKIIAA